jgi:hypothetical protein
LPQDVRLTEGLGAYLARAGAGHPNRAGGTVLDDTVTPYSSAASPRWLLGIGCFS